MSDPERFIDLACPHIDVASRPSDADGWKRFGEQAMFVLRRG